MERPQTVENLPVLYLDHRPREMESLRSTGHGFILETVSAGPANRYFILTSSGKTILVVVTAPSSTISHVHSTKLNYVCTIRSAPKKGERMKITRSRIDNLELTKYGKNTEDNILLSGPLVMDPIPIWQGFFYVESEFSSYFFCS